MSGHTPGPWIANAAHSGNCVWRVESAHDHGAVNDGWAVAEFFGPDAEGNAALCGATPTMHRALRAHAAYAACVAGNRGSLPQRTAIYEHAQALTAQALAAVSGEVVPEYVGDAEVERLVDEALEGEPS